MMTDFQRKKFDKLFSFWDSDNNGKLEQADYEAIAQRIVDERGWEQGSPLYESTFHALLADWGQARAFADADDNASITRPEWIAYCQHILEDDDAYFVHAVDMSMGIFNAVDADDDGYLLPEDYAMFFRIYNANESEARFAFEQIDTNNDGRISLDELLDALNEFFRGSDPTAPGNFLFGRLG